MQLGKKTVFEQTLYTGFGMFTPVGVVNPTRKELADLKGYEYKEKDATGKDIPEILYEGKDSRGEEYVKVVVYLQHKVQKNIIIPVAFPLYDTPAVIEKDGVTKTQYVNQQGGQAWLVEGEKLDDKFTKVLVKGTPVADREYRPAFRGEANLYAFLQAWLDRGVAFYGENAIETKIWIQDKKKIFNNVQKFVKEQYTSLIGDEVTGSFNALAIVNIHEKDGKINHYQGIHTSFWPDWKFKDMVGAINNGDWDANDNTRKTKASLEKGLKKAAFTLGWLKEFVENEHLQASTDTFRTEEEGEDESDSNAVSGSQVSSSTVANDDVY